MSNIYIGLISGTSVDGIDAVVIDYTSPSPKLLASMCYPIPDRLTTQIIQLCDEKVSNGEVNLMATLDVELGQLFAQAALSVCKQANLTPQAIAAIGHHGQTIRHYPLGVNSQNAAKLGFTVQIADANTLAVQTGIKVVADFRRKDVALGGQGAPMVPAFHKAAFEHDTIPRFIVNIGGIGNLTYLPPACTNENIIGYDTGPGNTLLDKWARKHINKSYDDNGQWASTGKLIKPLLEQLLTHPYLALPAPKSTGREEFNQSWLNQFLEQNNYLACDVQATLVHFTAITIAEQIKAISQSSPTANSINAQVYVCGGGASNGFLMAQLTAQLPQYKVATTNDLGVNPDWVEAIAFSWLAKAYIEKIPGNIPSVTGASRQTVLGGQYLP